jgi:hypothetical protein
MLELITDSFVKASATVRKDNRDKHDRLASSLKKVGIVEEACRTDAKKVLSDLQSLAIRKFPKLDWQPNNDGALPSGATKPATTPFGGQFTHSYTV